MRHRYRVIVVDSNYPSATNPYGDVFVHARVRHYQQHHEVSVLGWSKRGPDRFEHEGVMVEVLPSPRALIAQIEERRPDLVLVHFAEGWVRKLLRGKLQAPVIIWVHGFEALGWYRRWFNITSPRRAVRMIGGNVRQMYRFHRVTSAARTSTAFVFPSRWMRELTRKDTLSSFRDTRAEVLPNPIDVVRFPYVAKVASDRHRVLVLKSYSERKYATDIVQSAILEFVRRHPESPVRFTICGDGVLWNRNTSQIAGLPCVDLRRGFVDNAAIAELHRQHGVLLCPTRMDAQGVSMCEAMASGLVPIASNNTAIPEFVDESSGILCDDVSSFVSALERLDRDPEAFLALSKGASNKIAETCSHELVIDAELRLFDELVRTSTA